MSRVHILVVDDTADARDSIADVLEMAGYAVRKAENGRVALGMMIEEQPALVLLDLMMPVMNGWEFLDAVRMNENLRSIPVVVVSAALTMPEGVPLLRKPVELDQLLRVVRDRSGITPDAN